MARHDIAPSASGAWGRLGPVTTRMPVTGAATSSVRSVFPTPIGISSGRSRFVQVVRTDSWRRSPANGAWDGSTSDRKTSLPM